MEPISIIASIIVIVAVAIIIVISAYRMAKKNSDADHSITLDTFIATYGDTIILVLKNVVTNLQKNIKDYVNKETYQIDIITNSINTSAYSYLIIAITIAATTINIIVPIVVYIIVDVITLFLDFTSSASIKNLNIDSSIMSVIIGNKNVDSVTKKSYVPYSSVLNFDVYNGNSKKEITCVLSLPIAIIMVFANNLFFWFIIIFYLPVFYL